MLKSLHVFFATAAVLLTGCAVPSTSELFSSAPEKDYSNLYLRGVFNWWEATEPFKFEPVNEDILAVQIELIADGQPYDFKVADATWSPAYNCGLGLQSMSLTLDQSVELYCFNDSLNLQFTPFETAVYRFELDISNNQYPELTILTVTQ
jgi:hypothetical protein